MTDLFWPGDHRADEIFSDAAYLAAMVSVENAWLGALVDAGVAPVEARADLTATVTPDDARPVAAAAEADGNPVRALLELLRERSGPDTARWLHRGLTSQDVVDTALMLCLRDALTRIRDELTNQVGTLVGLADTHHDVPMLARTLTQPALPSTVGMKMANWLAAVLEAAETVNAVPTPPVQVGGAAGTMAAATELTGTPAGAIALAARVAAELGLVDTPPWHTNRASITRAGDAMVTCCDAWAHIANDVTTASRAENGEFSERHGGRSSTMPHKNNPVLSVLVRRAALAAPPLGATLHAASAASIDERADGGWHTEWATLRTLARRTVVAGAQTSELLSGLVVDPDRLEGNLAAAGDLLAEQRTMAELTGRQILPEYTGATDELVSATLQRARHYLKEAR
ncbi:lyase family protein [Mycobacterium sp. DBP42]|uniref:lyase family protein n=1 Tax=Mycobacterium sp. DBP42 TaxID=2545267 RepID=UPI00110CD552|nr:lyase family protein [Mycobacterium sp. DBP42]TMS52441.1 3-carboxy-cis,cis-muconate cycloisomerase [Mycobacterium sp. DBP42]